MTSGSKVAPSASAASALPASAARRSRQARRGEIAIDHVILAALDERGDLVDVERQWCDRPMVALRRAADRKRTCDRGAERADEFGLAAWLRSAARGALSRRSTVGACTCMQFDAVDATLRRRAAGDRRRGAIVGRRDLVRRLAGIAGNDTMPQATMRGDCSDRAQPQRQSATKPQPLSAGGSGTCRDRARAGVAAPPWRDRR